MTAKLGYSCPSRAFPKESCDSSEPKKRGERKKEDLILAVDDPFKKQVSFLQRTKNVSVVASSLVKREAF